MILAWLPRFNPVFVEMVAACPKIHPAANLFPPLAVCCQTPVNPGYFAYG
ncbi:hypothetical protein [Hymenobacter guriensis]|nr:hypothetical protein [Hymenobacter guriensis]